jgi:subfamily B ATP-binding cassette protein MsbA
MPRLNPEAVRVYRRLITYVRPYRRVIVPAVLATTVYVGLSGIVPFFMEDAVAQLRDELLSPRNAIGLPLLIAFVFALRGVMNVLMVYGLSFVGRSAIRDLRSELFRHYLHMPARYYDRTSSGDLISKLTFNTEQIAEAISTAVTVLVGDTLLVLVMVGVMISYSLQLTLIIALVGPAIAILIGIMSQAFRRYSTRIQSSMGDVTRVTEQSLQGHRVVKIFEGQDYEQRQFDAINHQNFRLNLRLVATRALGDSLTQYVVAIGVAIMVFFVLSGWLVDEFDSPSFIGFITAVGMLLTPLKRLVNTNAALQRGIAAADSLFQVLDEPVEADAGAKPLERCGGRVEYVDVSFRYGNGETTALDRVSFAIPAGSTVALVGRSGSGKSTLAGLLPRFYDVTDGRILLDGVDIREYRLVDLRRQMSFVGQDVVLFDDTIAGNIGYGALGTHSRDALERAAEAAHVMEFVAALPAGLETPVGERGVLLSGGQRQRVAIARALLKNAPILILDEATSALDSESERKVQDALAHLMEGRTTLVIAHRLSTIERADAIVVMHDGRVLESGRHAELLEAGGHYSALYRMQFAASTD